MSAQMMSRIYKRETLSQGSTEERNHGERKRNVLINFRVAQDIANQIETRIALSGLSKQDFLESCLMNREFTVIGNIKTFDRIRKEMRLIYERLQKLQRVDELDNELLDRLQAVLEILERVCWDSGKS